GAGEVEHAIDRSFDVDVVRDVVLQKPEPLLADQVRDVIGRTRDEVVHPDHIVALRDESIAEVGAEEASGTCYQDSHITRSPPPRIERVHEAEPYQDDR